MSHSRKRLVQQLDDEFKAMDELAAGRVAVGRVCGMRGTHCEVDVPVLGGVCLALVPARLRGVVHLRRGSFVALQLGDVPHDARFKLRATVLQPLLPAHQHDIKAQHLWPPAFDQHQPQPKHPAAAFDGANPNRPPPQDTDDDDDEEEDDDDEWSDSDEDKQQDD